VIDLFIINGTREVSFPVAVPVYQAQKDFFPVKNLKPGDKVSPLIPKRMYYIRSWEWTRPTQYELLLQNMGKINAHIHIHLGEYAEPKYYIEWNGEDSFDPSNYVWHPNPKYRGELYFFNITKNKAEFKYFSPNKLIIEADISEPDTLVINQNYDKYWHAEPLNLINHQGLLGIRFKEKGNYLIKLSYLPLSFYMGLVLSLLGYLFIIFYLKRDEKV
jgi:hypothetical protein